MWNTSCAICRLRLMYEHNHKAMFDFKEFWITATNRSEAIYRTTSRPTTCISQPPTSKLNATHQAVNTVFPSANPINFKLTLICCSLLHVRHRLQAQSPRLNTVAI
jgi:hypothetical protein